MGLKEKLRTQQLTIGSWITLGQPAIAEIMAKAGFDWLVVDLEHSTISIGEAGELIRICCLSGVSPLVRLTCNDPNQIKRVMDAGAHGIIVPMVNSEKDAKLAVESVYYPAQAHQGTSVISGKRGMGLARAQEYGVGFSQYRQWLEKDAVVIVQIEHREAVQNLPSILATPGVDGYLLGPYDLSASMGCAGQFDHPEFLEAIDQVKKEGVAQKKAGGIHIIEPKPEELKKRIAEGFKFLAYSLDIRMLDTCCRRGLEALNLNQNPSEKAKKP